MFGQPLEINIVEDLLNFDENIKDNYEFYQLILECIQDKDFRKLTSVLSKIDTNNLSKYMKTSA